MQPATYPTGRRLLSGRLDLEFAADAEGKTYLGRQYASYPFHICRTQFQDREIPGLATLYIQSCSGGVYEDDFLDLAFVVRKDAAVHVATQSATIVHTMPSGSASQLVQIQCERGAFVEYLPDPQILFPRSSYRSTTRVRLSEDAIAVVSDSILQHDPAGNGDMFSSYRAEFIIENADSAVLAIDRLELQTSPQLCPGILGSFAAQGTLIVACLNLPSTIQHELMKIKIDRGEAAIGVTLLPKSAGLLVRILAADGASLKRVMHMVWCGVRFVLKGSIPVERRK